MGDILKWNKRYTEDLFRYECRAFQPHVLACNAGLLCKKGKEVSKENAANITVPDKKAIFNLLLDARNIMEGRTDAASAAQKYIHCCPAVQALSVNILEESAKYMMAKKGKLVIETA